MGIQKAPDIVHVVVLYIGVLEVILSAGTKAQGRGGKGRKVKCENVKKESKVAAN